MSVQVGIVGLPNVGKSTLFNALVKRQQALAANYPFATIEPNVGVVAVPDKRLDKLAEVVYATEGVKPPKVSATIEFVDIAGIVAGAHKGEGLGNQFLSHIREVDLIAQVIRDFEDGEVIRTGVDAKSDFEVVESELMLKDLETCEGVVGRLKRERDPESVKLAGLVERAIEGLNRDMPVRKIIHNLEEEQALKQLGLLTAKPEIVVVNVAEFDLAKSEGKKVSIAEKLRIEAEAIVVVSAKVESELAVLGDDDATAYLLELGVGESGLDRLAQTAYSRLELISFLTAGEKEVRAWKIPVGSSAQEAAGTIHSDFAKKFIKAEVVSYDDFIMFGGWKKCRDAGKIRLEGRDYRMEDGDVVLFKIGS